MRVSKKLKKICKNCGEEFYIFPSQLKRGDTSGTFCSKSCFYETKKPKMKGQYFKIHPLKEICYLPIENWKIAYLAGIIDGEGSVSFHKAPTNFKGISPFLSVTNTDENLMVWIQKEFGGHCYTVRDCSRFECRLALKNTILKTRYDWNVRTTKDCLKLLNAVLPFLIVKKAGAEKVINYCEECIINHEEKIKKFNKGELKMTYNTSQHRKLSEQAERDLVEKNKRR